MCTVFIDWRGRIIRNSRIIVPVVLRRSLMWQTPRSHRVDLFGNVFSRAEMEVDRVWTVSQAVAGGRGSSDSRCLRKAACKYTHPGAFARAGGGVMHETVLNYLGCAERPPSLPTASVTLDAGDVLYLPFGWWHEVHSHPDGARGHMCASVSHFYTPYSCRLGGRTCSTGARRWRAEARSRRRLA